jgi:GNAT superfamily N-acetyltransferase
MATITLDEPVPDADDLRRGASIPRASQHDPRWVLRGAQLTDIAAVKALFYDLHTFNASLDPRFALSQDWETHFDANMEEALRERESLCLVACEPQSGQPRGFVLAAIHHDSGLWRYRDWVEVEALYVEDTWRWHGLGAALLARACDWANRVGQPVVQLYVTASNEHALNFYRRKGFRETQAIMRKVLTKEITTKTLN